MRSVAIAVGLIASSALAEPRLLPESATSVLVLEGSARLISDTTGRPDEYPTLLGEGVFYTREGHDRLTGVTVKLQEDLNSIRSRLAEYDAQQVAPVPRVAVAESGWSTNVLLGAFLLGLAVGMVGGTVVVARAAR